MAADAQTMLDNINAIYQSELGRASDPVGAAFYADLISNKGTSLENVRAQIAGSPEGLKYTSPEEASISQIYQSELGRAADPGGLNYYTNQLRQGANINDIRQTINRSEEGTAFDRALASSIYQNQLGRTPDEGGLNYYTNLLQEGTPLTQIVSTINKSPEGRAYDLKTLQNAYQTTFNRPLDTEGETYWLGRMQEDPTINQTTLMDFLKKGAKGADIPGSGTKITTTQGTGTTTTNVVPTGTVTTPRFDTTMANQVIPQTIGPGAGAIESQIREGVLPQQVVIGGAPVNISGGYGAYPYGIESLAQTLGTPAAKLREMAANPTRMTSVFAPRGVSLPTAVGGTAPVIPQQDLATQPFSSFAAPTMTTPTRTADFYTNPYAGMYAPAPYKSMYGPITGPGGVEVKVPAPIVGATSAAPATPNAAATTTGTPIV